jgi:hypothetical protein
MKPTLSRRNSVRSFVETGDAVQQCRFAGTRRSHDGGEPALLELDGEIIESTDCGLAFTVNLGSTRDAGCGCGHSETRSSEISDTISQAVDSR